MMAFCKHRVMDKCGKDNRPCIFSEDCFEPEPMTNAQRIRAMSDEELALELALIAEWDRKEFAKAKKCPGLVQFMREWLRKSEEVDGTWID